MREEIRLFCVFIALFGGLFLFLVSPEAEEPASQSGDLSRYYTPKYKDPNIYTHDPTEQDSLYRQSPQMPDALSDRIKRPAGEWTRPEELSKQKIYIPPAEIIPFTFVEPEQESKEEEIETKEGNITLETFGEELSLAIENITGKRPKLSLIDQEADAPILVKPVTSVEEEEEKAEQEPSSGKGTDEWKVLLKKGRISLKAPSGTSKKDLEAVTTYFADLLGRRGEMTMTPEGIEIKLK